MIPMLSSVYLSMYGSWAACKGERLNLSPIAICFDLDAFTVLHHLKVFNFAGKEKGLELELVTIVVWTMRKYLGGTPGC